MKSKIRSLWILLFNWKWWHVVMKRPYLDYFFSFCSISMHLKYIKIVCIIMSCVLRIQIRLIFTFLAPSYFKRFKIDLNKIFFSMLTNFKYFLLFFVHLLLLLNHNIKIDLWPTENYYLFMKSSTRYTHLFGKKRISFVDLLCYLWFQLVFDLLTKVSKHFTCCLYRWHSCFPLAFSVVYCHLQRNGK